HWAEYLAAWPADTLRGEEVALGDEGAPPAEAPMPADALASALEAAPVAIVETTTETKTTETTIYIDSSSIRA
ncbi:MAG: hypothetical protein M3Z15_06755, partial [Pseudomonadota bacterium]|nr:hypothetical protein [Pseudomonadota bacterium]